MRISTSSDGSSNWLTGWSYRRKLTIDQTKVDADLSDFPVLVKLTSSNFDFSKARSNGYDIRFTSANSTTPLKYERERYDQATSLAEFHVKISSISGTVNTDFYMYYGKSDATAGDDPTAVWDANFKAVLHMKEDNSGAISYDSTSNTNNFTKKGAGEPAQIDGKIGKGQDFDGANDYATRTISISAANTIEMWIKTDDIAVSQHLWNNYTGTVGNTVITNYVCSPNRVGSSNYNTETGGNGVIFNGVWYYLVFTRDGTNTEIFKDGVSLISGAVAHVATNKQNDIGRRFTPDSEWFNGIMDEVRYSNSVRSVAWIKASYNSGNDSLMSYGAEEQPPYYPAGEFQSRAIDTTKKGTVWGNISWGQNLPGGTSIKLKTRTGNTATPDGSWSDWNSSAVPTGEWFTVTTGTPIASPRSRYIQYISSFTTIYSTNTPQFTEVNIQYSTNTATKPNLQVPANDVWISSTNPLFNWQFVDNELDTQTGFRLQLSTAINFSVINHDSGDYSSTVSTYQPVSVINNGIYYWQVRSSDTYGEWSVYSSTYLVKLDTAPPTNVSISSCSAGSYSQITVYFTANDTGSGLAGSPYYVEMSTASNFGGDITNSGWISTINYPFSGLTRNKKYYFRVKAKDNAGNVSDPSSVVNWQTKPGTYQEKTVVRTPPNSFGFVGDGLWEWEVAAKVGQLITITAYVRYNSSYGAAGKPKLTLYNLGVNSNATMSASSDTWEQLQVSGTPNRNGVLKLKIEGYSTVPGAKMFVDDISISQ